MGVINNELTWLNMGDVNPLDWGSTFVSMDTICGCFFVLELEVIEGMKQYRLHESYVDITDSWIDWDSVYNCYGVEPNRVKFVTNYEKALFIVGYYGHHELGGYNHNVIGLSDVIEYLDDVGIRL